MNLSLKQNFLLLGFITIISTLVFPNMVVAAVPDEYKSCIPIVTDFKVTPSTLTSRTQNFTAEVRVETISCIVRGDVSGGPKWQVRLQMLNDNGNDYPGNKSFPVPGQGSYIKGSDFKRKNNNAQHADYNKYFAVYKLTGSGLFENQTGNTIKLRPNLWWDFCGSQSVMQVQNTNFTRTVTAPAGSSGTGNSGSSQSGTKSETCGADTTGGNVDTSTGATIGDLDKEVGKFFNPLNVRSVPELITAIIRVLFAIIGILSVIIIIVAGFRMVLANGNEEQLTKAKKALTWAVIGLVVSLLSFSIVAIIQRLIQVGA